MIKLANLPGDKGTLQGRKRVGRGESSGWGRTSGKGNKGAQARTGTPKGKNFEGGQTPLNRRVPKRGFSNQAFSEDVIGLNVSQLERFESGATINLESLAKAGLVSKNAKRIKILGNGDLTKNLTVAAHGFSASAEAKIKAAGGTCEILKKKEAEAAS